MLGGLAIVADRLSATRVFEADARILTLPAVDVLTKDDAQSTALLPFLDPEDGVLPPRFPHWMALPDEFALALQLALESGGTDTVLNGTAHWAADENEALEGSHILDLTAQHHVRRANQLHSLLAPLAAHAPSLFGAAAFSSARMRTLLDWVEAHAVVPPPLQRPVVLRPLPQLRLHYRGAATLWYDLSSGNVTLYARRRIALGDEITIDAGRHTHGAIMLRQGDPGVPPAKCPTIALALAIGMSTEDAKSNGGAPAAPAVVPLTLSLPDDDVDALAASKEMLLQKASMSAGGETFELRAGEPPPPRLLAYARVLVLQEHELELVPDGELPMAPLTPSNEEHAFRLIATTIDKRLSGYQTSIEEDDFELTPSRASSRATPRARHAPASARSDTRATSRREAAVCAALMEKRLLAATVGELSASVQAYLVRSQASAHDGRAPDEGGGGAGRGPRRRRKPKRSKSRGSAAPEDASKSEL